MVDILEAEFCNFLADWWLSRRLSLLEWQPAAGHNKLPLTSRTLWSPSMHCTLLYSVTLCMIELYDWSTPFYLALIVGGKQKRFKTSQEYMDESGWNMCGAGIY